MKKFFAIIILFILPYNMAVAEEIDYLKERISFANKPDYNANKLYLVHMALLDEHYKLAKDPNKTIDEINQPLQKLSEIYPIGVQVNITIANFLEYIYQQSGNNDDAKQLLEISKIKRDKAKAILESILSTGDGKSKDTAYKVINLIEEDAVLEHYNFKKVGQSVTKNGPPFFDIIDAKDASGLSHEVFFDISIFYKGK